jgi:hypothetical protein
MSSPAGSSTPGPDSCSRKTAGPIAGRSPLSGGLGDPGDVGRIPHPPHTSLKDPAAVPGSGVEGAVDHQLPWMSVFIVVPLIAAVCRQSVVWRRSASNLLGERAFSRGIYTDS